MSGIALADHAGSGRRRLGGNRRLTGKLAGPMLTARLAACALAAAFSVEMVTENLRFRIFAAWLSGSVLRVPVV